MRDQARHRSGLPPATAWCSWLAVLAACVVLCLKVRSAQVGATQPEPWPLWGFVDFRDTILLPTKDLLSGHNPYEAAGYQDRHPHAQMFNLYLPQQFLLLGWMAFLPSSVPIILFCFATALSLAWLVRLGLRSWLDGPWYRMVLPLCVLVLLLRGPGVMSVRQGQLAVVLAALSWFALTDRRRPWLQALATSIVLIKPQTGLALLVLVLVLRGLAPFLRALAMTALLAMPGGVLAIHNAGGLSDFINAVRENLAISSGDDAFLGGPVDIPSCLRALGLTVPSAVQAVITLALLAVLAAGIIRSNDRLHLRRFSVEDRHWLWLVAVSLVLVLPNQRYALGVLVPVLLLSVGALVSKQGSLATDLMVVALGGYALLRSETFELALGLPIAFTHSLTGWLVLGCLLVLIPRTAGRPAPRR